MVSAITHTPASGPFEPVTTPPMSSGSIGHAAATLLRGVDPGQRRGEHARNCQ
jgi:hypothetical protein